MVASTDSLDMLTNNGSNVFELDGTSRLQHLIIFRTNVASVEFLDDMSIG